MKRKGWILLFLIPLIFPLLSIRVFASPSDSLREFADTEKLWEALPEGVEQEELLSFLQEDSPAFSFQTFLSKLFRTLTCSLKDSAFLFCGLFLLLLASCLFENVKKSFGDGVESAFDFLFLLAAALFCFANLNKTLEITKTALDGVNAFLLASLPVSTVLLTLSGSLQFSQVQTAHLSFVVSLVSTLLTKFLFPVVRVLFCFSFLDGFDKHSLSGLSKFLQKGAKRLCVFFFTTVSALLALKGALASAADSLAMRSVRFAAGTFIPVVGTLVGESSKTLAASFQLVKTECGVICLLVLIFVLLQPILCVVIQKTVLSLAAGIGEILGEKRCGIFFKSLSGVLDLILALLISHACYALFTITLFLRAKGNV